MHYRIGDSPCDGGCVTFCGLHFGGPQATSVPAEEAGADACIVCTELARAAGLEVSF